jgi:isoleucyl-tRNA synthetase
VAVGEFKNLNADVFTLNLKPKADYVISTENNKTVVLDITIDENLMLEGLLRELIRQAQVLRKEADFKIDARVMLNITSSSDVINKVINNNVNKIKEEVLAQEFNTTKFTSDIERVVEVGDYTATISLKSL